MKHKIKQPFENRQVDWLLLVLLSSQHTDERLAGKKRRSHHGEKGAEAGRGCALAEAALGPFPAPWPVGAHLTTTQSRRQFQGRAGTGRQQT